MKSAWEVHVKEYSDDFDTSYEVCVIKSSYKHGKSSWGVVR